MNNYDDVQIMIDTATVSDNFYVGFEGLYNVEIVSIDCDLIASTSAPLIVNLRSQLLKKTNLFTDFMFCISPNHSIYNFLYKNVQINKYVDFAFISEANRAIIALSASNFIVNLRFYRV